MMSKIMSSSQKMPRMTGTILGLSIYLEHIASWIRLFRCLPFLCVCFSDAHLLLVFALPFRYVGSGFADLSATLH